MRTYNFNEVICIVHGRRIRGFAETDSISIERDEDSNSTQVGADGEVTRSSSNNKAGKFILNIQQASPDNEYLQSIMNNDEQTGTGIGATVVTDLSGTGLGKGLTSWLVKPAGRKYSRDAGEMSWTIQTDNLELTGGGNPLA